MWIVDRASRGKERERYMCLKVSSVVVVVAVCPASAMRGESFPTLEENRRVTLVARPRSPARPVSFL